MERRLYAGLEILQMDQAEVHGPLKDKIAIVTGGSRGIGRAIATRFATAGALVVVASRSALDETTDEHLVWQRTDVANLGQVTALTKFALDRFGRIDVLVNNAGVQLEKSIVETTDTDWAQLNGVNVHGVFLCCRSMIPVMQRQGQGVIINIGSISADHADPNMAIYNASKAFVHGLTRSIAVDHGRDGIRCNAICPGWIMTDMAESGFAQADDPESARRNAIAQHPVGRLGEPDDIASLAVWLASDEAGFASGQLFTVDGGLTAASPVNPGKI